MITIQENIIKYNNLLNERVSLASITPGQGYHIYEKHYHRQRINQLRRQVNNNIKRIETVIHKMWLCEQ